MTEQRGPACGHGVHPFLGACVCGMDPDLYPLPVFPEPTYRRRPAEHPVSTHPRKWSEKAGCWLYWSNTLGRYVAIPD